MKVFILFALIAVVSSNPSGVKPPCGCLPVAKGTKAVPSSHSAFVPAYADFKISTGEDLHKYRDQCKTELTISDETIEQFKKWQFTSDQSACYINCVFRHMHLYDNEHGFLVDNLVAQLGQGRTDDVRPDIEKCIDNSVADHCQRAFKGFQCFSKNNLQMIKSSVN